MDQSHVELLYTWLDETAELIGQEIDLSYLELLPLAGEILIEGAPSTDYSENLQEQLSEKLKTIKIEEFKKEEIRKGLQLAILKGMKGSTQQQHLITPDSVAIFMGYLIQKVLGDGQQETIRLFDPATGTANLLTAIINQMEQSVEAYGSEVDPTLIQLGLLNANLQKAEVEFFHQDSLRPLLLEPVDIAVADLPVGYYPDDVQAANYTLKAEEGHSYSHHLFIEQTLHYVKEGGYSLFLIPNFLFDSDQSEQLHAFLQEHVHVVGVLQLPESMFKNEKFGKSIFIVQKKGQETKAPKQALMAKLPSFQNAKAMNDMVNQINDWFKSERMS
ncbi:MULTISPECIES: class I SAM-dependent methyltransferase [Pontibacillus]|uniref:Class I SAM-dependent methyltransferase n=1 Tax=Pontibacillus chungwhensis TaxID=265426 RepID=A0ABY8UXU8_9BACI|nr:MULTISPECIES: class I SAM-dependent methyltransferase [Pontibacillus]MCD5323864.1 class I SAM-dependent methyltransferase [Pontibacillus sp. HN14]WIF97225.1 class I SAM-dependent methyltransferase [Pontibacillus chungwhensis]